MDKGKKAAGAAPDGDGEPRAVGLALQGGGSHGAFTWGVLDRLLEEVEPGRLRIAAISGASAGGINATLCACGLALGGATAARRKLRAFWEAVSRSGTRAGNPFFGFAEPGPFGGWNIDWSPLAIALEAVGLVISPYNNPFDRDALRPLLEEALPATEMHAFNQAETAARVFVSATNVRNDQRTIFTQPEISIDALRASACLPTEFRAVTIDGVPYWDGGVPRQPSAVAAHRCHPGPDPGDGQSSGPAGHAAAKCARHSGSPERDRLQCVGCARDQRHRGRESRAGRSRCRARFEPDSLQAGALSPDAR